MQVPKISRHVPPSSVVKGFSIAEIVGAIAQDMKPSAEDAHTALAPLFRIGGRHIGQYCLTL